MNRTLLITAVATVLFAGAAMAAPQDPPRDGRPAPMARLDANGDGAIDRAEAAQAPRLAASFDTLDRNGDGRLTSDERPHRGGGMRRGHHRGEGLDRIIGLDANGDGRISKVEAGDSGRFATRFDAIDANHDGYVVRSELRAHHERMRDQRIAEAKARHEEKFKSADTNKDGRLSRSEVDAGMPRLARAFAFMDENRDGYLSRAELEPVDGRRYR